ncbi:tachylectin-related carbohydrate-binding protein [Streptomyces sp. LP05-1]|uniref:Tachylectin-related carbohydrate-binding protein n=1 Tax=Streptomyces pyxinae TaxID=2970734 RepID=A0ABT2CMC7_9ACTN|nr:tachylectin-related carbohydrate-binding protein [Streptomyces sp. LP05-1]MCS0637861.1 tachylectin-related carbohydrate-binding protein [Streptomyces sp. LP05-1]
MRPGSSRSSDRSGRWAAILAAAATALPLVLGTGGPAHAADAAACTADGPTYAVNAKGELLQYKMKSPLSGSGGLGGATVVGSGGWQNFGLVLAGPTRSIYAFKPDGTYYAHHSPGGTWDVMPKKVSSDFGWLANAEGRGHAAVDGEGRLWVVDNDGALLSYVYDTLKDTWSEIPTKAHDRGWDRYDLIVAGDAGVLYGRSATDGKLYRSRFDVTSQRWVERHVLVHSGDWRGFKHITSNGGDTLIATKKEAGEAYYYRFDENTRTWAVNAVEVGSGGWQKFSQVSASPNTCRTLQNHTPAAPAVALESFSRTSVFQSSAGTLEYAYTDNIGRLVHGRQSDPSNFDSTQWTTISGNEAFSGQPSLSQYADGRVSVTGYTTSGSVRQRVQKAKGATDWAAWTDLAGAMAQPPVTAKTPGGLVTQFAADASGRPWYRTQDSAKEALKGWMPLTGSGFTGPFTAATVRDGIQLFGKNASGVLSTALFGSAGTLSAWTPLGAQAVSGTPAVVVYPGYRIRVFATTTDGGVVSTAQTTEKGAYAPWSPVEGVTAAGSPSAVISPLTGVTEVVVRGTDGYVHNTGETVQGSGAWRPWQLASADAAATDPAAFMYSDSTGPTWAYAVRNEANKTSVYQVRQTSSFRASLAAGTEKPSFGAYALPAPPAK